MNQKQSDRQEIDGQQLRRRTNGCFRPPRKYQRKVQKQSGCQKPRYNLRPVNFPVKRVQFPAEMEGPENERNQTKDVKMHGARSVPAADKNEQTDEKIEKYYDSEEGLGGKRLHRRCREHWGSE